MDTVSVKSSLSTRTTHAGRRLLEEDEYVGKLEDVIESQYFPHLHRMRKQLDHLRRNELFSLTKLRETYRKLTSRDSAVFQVEHESSSITVEEFFRSYVSEDNASFEVIFSNDIAKHRRKFHWMHEALDHFAITDGQSPTQDKRAGMLMLYYVGNKLLSAEERSRVDAILAGEDVMVGDSRQSNLDSWAFRVRNQLMFYPELKDSEQTSRMHEQSRRSVSGLLTSGVVNPLPGHNAGLLLLENRTSTNSGAVTEFKPPKKRLSSATTAIGEPKAVQRECASQPGAAFAQCVEEFLMAGRTADVAPHFAHRADIPPLEEPHTPTTIDAMSPRSVPSSTDGDSAISFHFQQKRPREELAHRLDAQMQDKKRQKLQNASSSVLRTPTQSVRSGSGQQSVRSGLPSDIRTPLFHSGNSVATLSGSKRSRQGHVQTLADMSPAAQALAKKVQESVRRQAARSHL